MDWAYTPTRRAHRVLRVRGLEVPIETREGSKDRMSKCHMGAARNKKGNVVELESGDLVAKVEVRVDEDKKAEDGTIAAAAAAEVDNVVDEKDMDDIGCNHSIADEAEQSNSHRIGIRFDHSRPVVRHVPGQPLQVGNTPAEQSHVVDDSEPSFPEIQSSHASD